MDEVLIEITEIAPVVVPDDVTIAISEALQGEPGVDGTNGTDASVTKANVEAVLIGTISSHSHAAGSISSYDIWIGTEAAYTALGVWDANTIYYTT